jgi:hypothetical protein
MKTKRITDKQRLDWLTKNAWGLEHLPIIDMWVLRCKHPSDPRLTRTVDHVRSPRVAIDAAIKAAQREGREK